MDFTEKKIMGKRQRFWR